MTSTGPLVSVIVPVYNVEHCIESTLRSIEAQTYSNTEIILVDDGSTDLSGQICEKWAHRNAKFKVVHKSNAGLSSARNTGINLAQGEYISFVDGDDLLDPKALEYLLDALLRTSSDVAIGSLQKLCEGTDSFENNRNASWRTFSARECLEKLLFCNGISVSACGKLFRSAIWKDIKFPVGSYYEDIATIPIALASCNLICATDFALYGYVTRSGSITGSTSLSEKKYFDFCSELNRLQDALKKKRVGSNDAIGFFSTFTWLRLFRYLPRRSDYLDPENYIIIKSKLRKNSSIWATDKRTTCINRIRLLLFSISPALYEFVFCLYAKIVKLNVV